MHNETDSTNVSSKMVANLIALSQTDTLYRDLYLQRARIFLQEEMSPDGYLAYQRRLANLVSLPNQIRNAMNDGDWHKVRDLSQEHKTLEEEIERQRPLHEFGKFLYESSDIPIDPFSPGMRTIPGVTRRNLAELSSDSQHELEELAGVDKEWQALYTRRAKAFEMMAMDTESTDGPMKPSASTLEEEALKALETGDFDKLEQLAEDLTEFKEDSSGGTMAVSSAAYLGVSKDYLFQFTADTIKQARSLGLALYHVPSRREEFASLCRFAWHPNFAASQANHSGVLQVPELSLPKDTPAGLRSRIQLFATHPLINSAGIRFLPSMAGEDVLVEDFDEPVKGAAMPNTGLLKALDFPQRSQLSRLQIEARLQERGNVILRDELGLDPLQFKLVCIPPDLHLRIGLECGWGQQEIWTHFDGYMVMADGKLWALAGGDIRYGGIYDLLGIARNYDSDRVIVRFAVVQRQRMAIRPFQEA